MKKLYQVILSNACERMPINETVLAYNREHALNYILKKHNEYIDNFVVVLVQEIENEAPDDLNHNENLYIFSDDNILVAHSQHKKRSTISINVGNQVYEFDSGIFEIIVKEHLKKGY